MCLDAQGRAVGATAAGTCLAAGGGGGGLSVVDQTAFTQGTSAFTPGGGVFNDASTLTSGQEGTFRMTTKRAQIMDVDASGSQLHADLTSAIATGTNNIGNVKIVDTAGTNLGTVKPASTAPVATDTSLVTALNPNSPGIITLGPAAAASSVPMTVGPALLGSYCMGANTGTMAAGLGAGSPIFSFRYGGAALAIVRRVSSEADDVSTALTAGAGKFDLIAARAFTASDTGGTAGTLTGNNGKMRTSFATTGVSDFRISSTATLTAGTRTLDTQPLASVEFPVSTTADGGLLPTTDLVRTNVGESPLVLATNEGFVIQATVPGTGTWSASVRVCWDEVSAF